MKLSNENSIGGARDSMNKASVVNTIKIKIKIKIKIFCSIINGKLL